MTPNTLSLPVPLALLALLGCARGPLPATGEPGPALSDAAAEAAYREVLDRHTARQAVYDALDTRLFVAATIQRPPFIEARVRRRGAFQAQPEALVAEQLERELSELSSVHVFHLGVHLNDPRYDDFDKKDSIWRLALVAGGAESTPSQVRRLGRSNLNVRAIYPYMQEFWVGYEVRFPAVRADGQPTIPPGAERVTLRLASTLGKADLEFALR